MPHPARRIGDVHVPPVGLGAMPLSVRGRPDAEQAVRTIHAALDAGVRLVDTADAYGLDGSEVGHNERLVAEALRRWPGDAGEVLVATKGGHLRAADGAWLVDGRPEHLRRACEASLRALGVDAIGLYQLHRPDPRVPVAESAGALAELRAEGKVRLVGVSNASVAQIDEARAVAPVVSVQNELSPRYRASEAELAHCTALGLAFLAWSPLGGIRLASSLGDRHPDLAAVAAERGVSPQRVCLAWLLAKSPRVVPIPGARRPESILDSVAAAELALTEEEVRRLDAAN